LSSNYWQAILRKIFSGKLSPNVTGNLIAEREIKNRAEREK